MASASSNRASARIKSSFNFPSSIAASHLIDGVVQDPRISADVQIAILAILALAMAAFLSGRLRHDIVAMGALIAFNVVLRHHERIAGAAIWNGNFSAGLLGRLAQAVLSIFDGYDLYLSPTLAKPPVPLGSFDLSVRPEAHYRAYLDWMPYTHSFNVSGSPAMSVPLWRNADGLPVGCQFAAPPAAEALLFRLANQLEAARPWAAQRPPVSFGA